MKTQQNAFYNMMVFYTRLLNPEWREVSLEIVNEMKSHKKDCLRLGVPVGVYCEYRSASGIPGTRPDNDD